MGIVYKITNKINGKAYIGATVKDFNERHAGGRWWIHTHNKQLQDDAFIYAKSSFDVSTLATCDDAELESVEAHMILLHNTLVPNGYNKGVKSELVTAEIIKNRSEDMRRRLYSYLDLNPMPIATGVRAVRLMLNMTQIEFAEYVGVSPRILMSCEQGRSNPTVATISRMLKGSGLALGINKKNLLEKGEKDWAEFFGHRKRVLTSDS